VQKADNSFLSEDFDAAVRSGPSGIASNFEKPFPWHGAGPPLKMFSNIVAYPTEEHEKTQREKKQGGFAKPSKPEVRRLLLFWQGREAK
jgi:hypothetical protein